MTAPCATTATILDGVTDDQLAARTPCDELSLSELVAHVGGLGIAFAAAARKDVGELTGRPPDATAYLLTDDWRAEYPANLAGLADAWRAADAWQGMTQVGGVDLPSEVCAMVGLTEVVIHGWDVAVATGQDYRVDDDVADAVLTHLVGFTGNGPVEGLFAAPVEIDDGASAFERALALSGRDPGWRVAREA